MNNFGTRRKWHERGDNDDVKDHYVQEEVIHPYRKRHRGEGYQPQQLSITEKIARLGETGSRNIDIGFLAKEIDGELANKGQDDERVKMLTARVCRCIVSFPTRTGTYATLIGLISVKHYNVACQIINILHASYPIYLEAQKWQEALTIMHTLASLVNCKVIRPSAMLSQFEFLLESTIEDNIPQARSDYYVYTVLSSLPYVALEFSTQPETQENFEKLLNTIETYLQRRSKEHLNFFRVWQSNDSTIQMDYLDSLWVQMNNFRANGWIETFLHRPYNEKEYKDTMASSLIPTNSPIIQVPGHSDEYRYPYPRIVLRLFEDDVSEGHKSIPGSDKIERFCIEAHIRSIIDEISSDPRGCARHLTHMYHSDQLPMKHLLVETILGELFKLPQPKHEDFLYHTLLYEFTKIFHVSKNPDEIKHNYDVILNEAVKTLFNNLDTMNVTCFTRFVTWFSFHLNNIKFVYPWQSWQDATGKPRDSPKSIFVQDILEHCVRFTFHKMIATLVQDSLISLMPQEVGIHYKPVFQDSENAERLKVTIKKLISEKSDGKTICETLNIRIAGVELPDDFQLKPEELSEQLLKVDIFTAVLLHMASRSLTHLSAALGKYLNVLKALTKRPECQILLMQTMHSCLETHPQLLLILIDKLLRANLLEPKEVCNWIFSESMKQYRSKSYLWELLNNTLRRSRNLIDRLIQEREQPKESITSKEAHKIEEKKDLGSGTPQHDNGDDDDEDMPSDSPDAVKEESEEEKKETERKEREQFDSRIADAKASFSDLLLQVFQLFANSLNDHINSYESSGVDYNDTTYKWLIGRMQEVYYDNINSICGIMGKLNEEIKTIVEANQSMRAIMINLNQ